jgi:CO dehydrogenase maturation factor
MSINYTAKTIITAGKGGTGKTVFLYHLLRRHALAKLAGRILVVDADPHQSLSGLLLGAHPPETLGGLKRQNEQALKRGVGLSQEMSRLQFAAWLTRQALVQLNERADLLVMGRSETQGCQCSVNSLLGQAFDALSRQYDWLIVDNEAGIEHIGRHNWPVDVLLLFTGAQPAELDVARMILHHASDTGREIRQAWTILSRAYRATDDLPAPLLGILPFAPQMLTGEPPDASWFAALDAIWQMLEVNLCACNGVTSAGS